MRMESQGLEEENDALEHHVRGAEDTTRTWLQNRRGGPRPGRSAVVMPTTTFRVISPKTTRLWPFWREAAATSRMKP